MKLRRPHQRTHAETVVPLIDVVFFLLIFFMMVGRMDATAPFSVTPPYGTTGSPMPSGGITVSVDATGSLAVDGFDTPDAGFDARITARLSENPDLLIRVNADRMTPLRIVLPVVSRLESLGARDVVLVVTTDPA